MQTLNDNAAVLENRRIIDGAELYDMLLECPEIASAAEPGQIVHVLCGEGTTLRRPISICETIEGRYVRLCYDVRGKGTKWMSECRVGERISLLGPLGHGFQPSEGRSLLVGGGIGIYPLLSIGKALERGSVRALFGFRTAALINSLDLFLQNGIPASIITDDGSSGRKGFVTELLREELSRGEVGTVYVCGPKPMMAAVASICGEFDVCCQVSMEERMGCGVGACLACVCKTMLPNGEGYKRVCVDGPVFNAKEIIWK